MAFESCQSPSRSSIIGNGGPNTALGTPMTRPRVVRIPGGKEFTVWPMSRDSRESNDVVHENISIPPAVQVILDSPPVQRLANLKQLGCAFFAYPCCTGTRKEHSLGVAELAGQLSTNLKQKQPQLNLSEKDILCLRIAGLCHDLGHGPFSHAFEAFLKASYKSEKENPEVYEQRNAKFKEEFGIEMPLLPEHYEHESTSLMMIDAALASVGLEINWGNLDEPLKQIESGIDREKFGVDLGGIDADRRVDPFTSRDWIFVKECVMGAPLNEPHAPTAQTDFVGRASNKEFLFDIVNNRHNGLDVDKIDYFDRDSLAAYGARQTNMNIFLRDASVAKGKCPNPKKCFKCRGSPHNPLEHLMICYPQKHLKPAMDFFAVRMKNHENIYTHKKAKAAELQMVDILLEADKHFSMLLPTQLDDPCCIKVPSYFDDFQYKRLPISRALMYPRLFLRLDDTIISIIEHKAIENPSRQLRYLRQLIMDRRAHKVYKRVGEVEIDKVTGEKFWAMSEDKIREDLLQEAHLCYARKKARYITNAQTLTLEREDDVIVEKRELHYGRGDKNPVEHMRFFGKGDRANLGNPVQLLPLAEEVKELPLNTPQSFVRRTVRVFCRSYEKQELVGHCFLSWKYHTEKKMKRPAKSKGKISPINESDNEDDNAQSESQIALCAQPADLAPAARRKRKDSDVSDTPLTTMA
eukprot:CAMPEP_0194247646 /NCGR_PEP_ID=MMETSP0158-20130606/16910_1 /TAXON_ID=33649 /ORGANISM="Thalassionema nitzschioides, Strain L26-B" /LENGTH=693 /DNA_ID=CAMNT_0038983773 /DNA_START=212 /DNA_END=2289 /DNA_ORIENTATION=+